MSSLPSLFVWRFFFSSTRVLLSMAIYTHYYFASATDQNEKNCTRIARIRVSLENWRNERSFVACFAHPSILSCRNDKMMKLQTIQIVRFPFQFKKKKKKDNNKYKWKNIDVVSNVKNSKKQRRERKKIGKNSPECSRLVEVSRFCPWIKLLSYNQAATCFGIHVRLSYMKRTDVVVVSQVSAECCHGWSLGWRRSLRILNFLLPNLRTNNEKYQCEIPTIFYPLSILFYFVLLIEKKNNNNNNNQR